MRCKQRKRVCCWAPKWKRPGDHIVVSIRGTQQPRRYLTELLEKYDNMIKTGVKMPCAIPLETQVAVQARWKKMEQDERQARAASRSSRSRSRSRGRASSIASTSKSASGKTSRDTSVASQKRGKKSNGAKTRQGRRIAGRAMTPARPQQPVKSDGVAFERVPHRFDDGKSVINLVNRLVLTAY